MSDQNMRTTVGSLMLLVSSMISLSGSQSMQFCSYFKSPQYLEASTTEQKIEIPGANAHSYSYKPNQNCRWMIRSADKDHVIKLTVTYCQLEGRDVRGDCVTDYVNIFDVIDGNNVFKARFCSIINTDLSYQSTQSEMIVDFKTNSRYEFSGFRAVYKSFYTEEDSANTLGVVFGAITGGVICVIGITVALVIFNIRRKRKASERRLRSPFNNQSNTQTNRNVSSQPAIIPNQSSDLSPFVDVHQYMGQDATSSRQNTRSITPPPPYEAMDSHYDLPPPSYATVLRESCNEEYPVVIDNSVV